MRSFRISAKRRLLIPEVVQTSMMDCGPASLKAMLEGWGVQLSYGRLREACQTDVDGTSIDTLEEVGAQLGLVTEQIMVPVDHVLLASAHTLPAIIVVRHPSGVTHFVIVWRRHGRFLQLMDPAVGRRWVTRRRFLDELYQHTLAVPAADWRAWAGSDEFLNPLRQRLAELTIPARTRTRLVASALADPGWRSLATLDAATRLVGAIKRSGSIGSGAPAVRLLEAFLSQSETVDGDEALSIPAAFWSVTPTESESGEAQLLLKGAVLVRVKGLLPKKMRAGGDVAEAGEGRAPLSPELVAALAERPIHPMRELFRIMRVDGVLAPMTLLVALVTAAAGVIVEALLLRGLLDAGRELVLSRQRLAAFAVLLFFLIALLLLEIPIAATALSLGRRLELRLRIAFLEKLPKLNDRYFSSRLTSDMAERAQSIHRNRSLPELGSQLIRASCMLALTAAAIAWLSPSNTGLVLLAAALAVFIPLAANPILSERDLRVRTHAGALSRFYLDALRGLVAIRTHNAETAVRREHEGLLVEWSRASRTLLRSAVAVESLQMFAGFGLAGLLAFNYLKSENQMGAAVLLVYWALSIPALGQEIAQLMRLYPVYRNITLRLLEPIGAIEDEHHVDLTDAAGEPDTSTRRLHILFDGVNVVAGGHTILEGINLSLERGEHVAIVGPSGAGKSSLVGLLLGWHRAASGRVLVDGLPLEKERLTELRRGTAWVDPSVQLWNRSLIDNLHYGARPDSVASLSEVIEAADLGELLEGLPDGMQTTLGEGGALVSGGEGQRVRLGRAMLKREIRLVILDEPFRGMDRKARSELLARARKRWQGATLLCITHDVGETLSFARVLIIENGRIREDDSPAKLSQRNGSRYRSLLDAEEAVRADLWAGVAWRQLRLDQGHLFELAERKEHVRRIS